MTRRLKPAELPHWPRRMPAPLAAAYMGVSPSKLMAGVKLGDYPPPQKEGANRVWDKLDLDEWLDLKRGDGAVSASIERAIDAIDTTPPRSRRRKKGANLLVSSPDRGATS